MFEENIVKLLNKWATVGPVGIQAALRLCRDLVFFHADPQEKEKIARRKENPRDWTTSLDPNPRFQEWEYTELLDRGIRPLAQAAPLSTATLLIEAVANMLLLDTGREPDTVDGPKNDASEVWCPRVDEKASPYSDSKSDLIRTLTFACEQVYERGETKDIEQLDRQLRAAKWYLFDRIRYHLYANHTERAENWIREAILRYDAYAKEQYGFEFQRMVRKAAERFGESLIPKDELQEIFEIIVTAPDKADYKEFMAEQFTEEAYRRRQDYFQLRQLTPFASLLFGKYAERYNALTASARALTDDDFVRYGVSESKTGASRSPTSVAELALLTDDELVSFLNDWEEVGRDPDEWWVDIDFSGLAIALQQVITANPDRFLNWGERWRTLQRPIYLRYALDTAAKRIAQHQAELTRWWDIASWIMSQSDSAQDNDHKPDETSRDHPTWNAARRQVVDFIEVCISKDVNIGLDWRPRVLELLRAACVAPDYYLDTNRGIITPRDYLTDAINTTRGRALENLLKYGFWVRRNEKDADVSELFDVLHLRFRGTPPLAPAEYALLGTNFHRIYGLSSSWAKENVSHVFPQEHTSLWSIGFAAYLMFNRAHPLVFDMLMPHFEFAVGNLHLFNEEQNARRDPVANLGQHLLDYFMLGLIDPIGPDSLLHRFYAKTKSDRWSGLFDHFGRILNNTAVLKPEIAARSKAFFELRLAEGNAEELKEFTFWLKAECLEAEWRLTAFLRTLDVSKAGSRLASMEIADLAKLAAVQPDLVVACFAKLTEGLMGKTYFYLRPEHVKPILKAGLSSKHETTVEAAKLARDNLLKAGRSEYRNLDAIKDETHWNE
jgi:hypothetical protein